MERCYNGGLYRAQRCLFLLESYIIRAVHDWEAESMAQLLKDIHTTKFQRGEVHKMEWILLKKLGFSK